MPDPNELENLDQNILDLMQEEQDKEITKAALVQGQIIALTAMLRRKGLFGDDDLKELEQLTMQVQIRMATLMEYKHLEDMAQQGAQLKEGVLEQKREEALEAIEFLNANAPGSLHAE